MTAFAAAAALIVAGLLVTPVMPLARASALSRLAVVLPTRPRRASAEASSSRRRGWWLWTAAVLAGLASWAFVGQWWGVVLGLPVAVLVHRVVLRLEPADVRAERTDADSWLPFAADLLAAALRAGATTDSALRVVADAVRGPVGDRFAAVGSGLSMGAPAAEAWQSLADLPRAAGLVQAGIRAADSGAALADTATALADRIRADLDSAAEASARRSGVLVVLPLGLCFLPAFVLLGVVPVVGSVLAGVLR